MVVSAKLLAISFFSISLFILFSCDYFKGTHVTDQKCVRRDLEGSVSNVSLFLKNRQTTMTTQT